MKTTKFYKKIEHNYIDEINTLISFRILLYSQLNIEIVHVNINDLNIYLSTLHYKLPSHNTAYNISFETLDKTIYMNNQKLFNIDQSFKSSSIKDDEE